MKELKIEIPKGYEIDRDKSTFEKIVFKEIKKELPKSWYELNSLDGFYVGRESDIVAVVDLVIDVDNRNVFKTKEQAEASIALSQLSQLRELYRQGWMPNWCKKDEKWGVMFENNKICVYRCWNYNVFLTFQTEEIAKEFLEKFRDLIQQVRPLMS